MFLETGKRGERLLDLVTGAGRKEKIFMTGREESAISRGVTTSTEQNDARS